MAGLRLGLLALLLLVILPQLRVWFERQGWPDVVDHHRRLAEHEHRRTATATPKVQEAADALAKQAGVSDADRLRLAQTLVTRPDPDWLQDAADQRKSAAARLPLLRPAAPAGRRDEAGRPRPPPWRRSAVSRPSRENDSTQLGAAVRQVLDEYSASSLAAVVILTDGVTTEGEDLVQASEYAKDQGVPLFFVGVGDANDVRNLCLHDLQAVDSVYVNDRIFFELTLTGQGYPGLTVPVTLQGEGQGRRAGQEDGHARASGNEE